MTVIAAAAWPDAGARRAAIGSDSNGTDGWATTADHGSKLRRFAFGTLGFSGSYRLVQAIEDELLKVRAVETYDDARGLAAIVEDGMQRAGWSRSSTDGLPTAKDLHLLVVSNGGRIWTVQSDLAVLQHRHFAAIGSGFHVALGALFACKRDGYEPACAVRRAIEASCAIVATCGGRLHLDEVRP